MKLYITKLYKDKYIVVYPKSVALMDLERLKLKLDTKYAKLPLYMKYLPYLAIWLKKKQHKGLHGFMDESPSIRRTELL